MLKTISVTQLNKYISNIFEAEELLQNVKVYGEVSNLSFVRGNLYFNLKDEDSLISCIMFGVSNCNLKEGDQIIATGNIRFYSKGGKINLYVSATLPYGSGLLYQQFIELKDKLEKEGIFNIKSREEIPSKINKIGIITSSTGAVLHDIVTVSHRRNPKLDIDVYPAKVQGKNAEKSIINGLKYFDKCNDIDVIIIARGGGSIEDLQPFNTEILAREIVKISKPIISAVGHETDYTICDFSSSLRAATPSEAAEIVAIDLSLSLKMFKSNYEKLNYLYYNLLDEKTIVMENYIEKLNTYFDNILLKKNSKLKILLSKFLKINLFENIENKFTLSYNKLNVINPIYISQMGWARITKGEKLINSIKQLKLGDELNIEICDGEFKSSVLDILKENIE